MGSSHRERNAQVRPVFGAAREEHPTSIVDRFNCQSGTHEFPSEAVALTEATGVFGLFKIQCVHCGLTHELDIQNS